MRNQVKSPKTDKVVTTQLSMNLVPFMQPAIIFTINPKNKEYETKKEVEHE